MVDELYQGVPEKIFSRIAPLESKQKMKSEDELMASVNETWFYLPVVPVEMPVGLNHLDADYCWCDPVVEADEDGEELVLHRQVTWN